ncbi:MAG: Protein kinase [Polyangiaceae bacterium]|jgi:serine/threonine-protein kinase|nr:Protein kinase [Polyangiaceae bacterium]
MNPATDNAEHRNSEVGTALRTIESRIGQVIAGTYKLTRYIASGGSGHVFEAAHVRLGKAFAVKLLRAELDTHRKVAHRFRREAQTIAGLKSEYVVGVVDCGELEDRTPYVVMELLEGEDLRSLLEREGSLPARRALHLMMDACLGLSVVHRAGLVHRDLKPENLFVARRETGEDWCKVLDFGIAKMESSLVTAQDAIVGTVRYMAPEQISQSDKIGPATDIYAIGAVLYECLSGKAAHGGVTVQEVMFSVMNRTPAPLSALNPNLPMSVVQIVDRCLSKSTKDRPQTAPQLFQLLRALTEARESTAPDSTWSNAYAPRRSALTKYLFEGRAPTTNAALLVLGAALLGAAAGWHARRALAPAQERKEMLQQESCCAVPPAASAAPSAVAASVSLVTVGSASSLAAPRRAPVPYPADQKRLPQPVPLLRLDSANPYER